jgi:hypothetical protein
MEFMLACSLLFEGNCFFVGQNSHCILIKFLSNHVHVAKLFFVHDNGSHVGQQVERKLLSSL